MQPIERLRLSLLRRRRALLHQVEHIGEDMRRLDEELEPELEEEAQEENISRLLAGLDARGREELDSIDVALTRIEAGEYGRCEDCEEPIPLERLEVLPTAATCVECSERRARGSSHGA